MKVTKRIEKEIIIEIFLFFAVIFTIAILWQNNVLLLVAIVIESAITIKLWHQKYDIVYFIVGAILGPLGEIIAIYFGVWSYANPSILGIPIWLPFVWGFAAIVLTRIGRTFIRMLSK